MEKCPKCGHEFEASVPQPADTAPAPQTGGSTPEDFLRASGRDPANYEHVPGPGTVLPSAGEQEFLPVLAGKGTEAQIKHFHDRGYDVLPSTAAEQRRREHPRHEGERVLYFGDSFRDRRSGWRGVACLHVVGGVSCTNLPSWGAEWPGNCRAAVRKRLVPPKADEAV